MDRIHGLTATYYAGCRCDECREANRLKNRRFRQDKKLSPSPNLPHGTYNGYTNHGCRCDACREASREHAAKHRRRKS